MANAVILGALLLSGCGVGSGEPELTDFELQVTPQSGSAPLMTTAQVRVDNTGDAAGTATLRLDGESRKEITVAAGERAAQSMSLSVDAYGPHTVTFGPQTTSVEADGLTFEHPDTVQVDERFDLTVKGLPNAENLTLRISSKTYEGETWANVAQLNVSEHQTELSAQKMMRLIQLMAPISGEPPASFFSFWPPVESTGGTWPLQMAVQQEETTLDRSTLQRQWGDPRVTKAEVEAEGLVGTLYAPPGEAPAPPVILLHGSRGNRMSSTASLLASHGFLALALQYFGESSPIPDQFVGVPIEYVQRAGEWLRQHKRASGDQVGLWGASRGGELALLAASYFEVFGAVVSISGSGVTWGGWTHQGEPLPQLLSIYMNGSALDDIDDERLAEATIPVERINGPVLMISGRRDRLWNAVTFSNIVVERLEQHNHPYRYQHLIYDEAGHLMNLPYLPVQLSVTRDGFPANFGGTREGAAEASADHWPKALEFLRRGLTADKHE